jgi:hypothetical protein
MRIKEYIVLNIVVACLTLLAIQTVKVLSLPLKQNIEKTFKQ